MSPAAQIKPPSLESSRSHDFSEGSFNENRRFAHLRGVQWRIDLGILPSSSSSSPDDFRRVTADFRRRYAGLRRRLLVDPSKDLSNSPDLTMDNPLSQNPDSMWGRFFRNAELERIVDQDLSRLYPENGSYFQTPGCQRILRRILLLWCLRHPAYGYRQGMHELLAPLLYVLHVDLEHLSQVQKLYEDHFIDKFDCVTVHESDLTYNFDFKKISKCTEDETGSEKYTLNVSNLEELDPKIQDTVLLSDAYGAEGELGILLSEKFMEHDAYCMFDALMSGTGGVVVMADFFSPFPRDGLQAGLPPVIEASSALYCLLSLVDKSLHDHLVQLGVEPQYFALRWLRVLFGREFSLENLLTIWDEIFGYDNSKLNRCDDDDACSCFELLTSPRGAFISSVAVSMILCMRSSLLATENATSCLQRLLNFPANQNLKNIIAKAKSLQAVALDVNALAPLAVPIGALEGKSMIVQGHSLSSDSLSPRSPLSVVHESYWEEKWRDLHKAEECRQSGLEKQVPNRKKGWSEKMRLRLTRTESSPSSSPSKVDSSRKNPKPSVRRSLLGDLSRQLGLEEDSERTGSIEESIYKDSSAVEVEAHVQYSIDKNLCTTEEKRSRGNAGSEENSSIFSDSSSPSDHENQSNRSSVASSLSIDENDAEPQLVDSPLLISDISGDFSSKLGLDTLLTSPEHISFKSGQNENTVGKPVSAFKEWKLLSSKFQWFLKFGRNGGDETFVDTKASNNGSEQNNTAVSAVNGPNNSSISSKSDALDQNVLITLRHLGQSMLDNIQVLESVVFPQERGQGGSLESFSRNVLGGKGQVSAMAALKELRKISNLLSEL